MAVVHYSGESVSTISTVLDSRILFLYSYLTVSHDNFDLTVKYNHVYDYGYNSLGGLNFIISRLFPNYTRNSTNYLVQQNLNTVNLLGTSYNDFGIIGCMVFSAVIGFIFGFVEKIYLKSKSIISLLLLSVFFYCIILSYYSNYTAQPIFIINISSILITFAAIRFVDKIVR